MSTERQNDTDLPEEPLLSRREGSLLVLTLNRPELLNALSHRMYQLLELSLSSARHDWGIRCIILTGAGRGFCSGADLKQYEGGPPTGEDRRRYLRSAQRVNSLIQTGPQPVIAAVNGPAVASGLEMALSADFMIVSETARLCFPEVSIGTFISGGSSYTLAERVGVMRARELIYLGDFFLGSEAADMGIALSALPTEEVLPASIELALRLSTKAPAPLARAKRLIGPAGMLSREKLMKLEAKVLEELFGTRDWQEGVDAFNEGRPPGLYGRIARAAEAMEPRGFPSASDASSAPLEFAFALIALGPTIFWLPREAGAGAGLPGPILGRRVQRGHFLNRFLRAPSEARRMIGIGASAGCCVRCPRGPLKAGVVSVAWGAPPIAVEAEARRVVWRLLLRLNLLRLLPRKAQIASWAESTPMESGVVRNLSARNQLGPISTEPLPIAGCTPSA